jgi:hypothetical protein
MMTFDEWWARYDPGDSLPKCDRAAALMVWCSAQDAERERCAVEAELVAENYRESAILHGEDQPMACYRARRSAALAVARRIRTGSNLHEEESKETE